MLEYHGDIVVHTWPNHYLRDDLATGVRDCDDGEAYSLFRLNPYGRLGVYAGRLEWAIKESQAKIDAAAES